MPVKRLRVAKKRSKSQINRLLSELRYYRELRAETEELFIEYDAELNSVLEDITSIVELPSSNSNSSDSNAELALSKNGDSEEKQRIHSSETDKKENSESKNEGFTADEGELSDRAPPWMKSLFKKIAIESHPDKVQNRDDLSEFEKNERSVLYKKASNAINSLEKMKLLEVGYTLGISPDLSEHEQKNIISSAVEEEKKAISSSYELVSWIWGENFGKIDIRSNLLVYVRRELNLAEVSIEIIREYVVAFENDEDLTYFKNKYMPQKKTKINQRKYRKVGERPAPSFVKSRK